MSNNHIYRYMFQEPINLENVKRFIQLDYDDYIFTFKAKEWIDETGKNKYTSKTYFKFIKKWLRSVILNNKSIYTQKYKFGLNQSSGRLYVRKCGIQSLPCLLKCYLLEGVDCTDYDMKNAHFRILRYLCEKHNLPWNSYEILHEYCINREDFLKIYQVSKMDCILCLYNDKCKNDKLKLFHKELSKLKTIINCLEQNNINTETKSKNPQSAILSKILCYYENDILQKVIKKYECYIPYYDGFIGETGIDLNDLNEITSEYGIEWSIKSLENNINLDHIDINTPDLINSKLNFFEDACQLEYTQYFVNNILEEKGKYIYYCTHSKGIWFEYDENNILKQSIAPPLSLREKITYGFMNEMNKLEDLIINFYEEGQPEYKLFMNRVKKIKRHVTTNIFEKNMTEKLAYILRDRDIINKLDNNNNFIVFKNKLYDFKTEQFRDIEKQDFISNYLEYRLPEPDEEIQKDINKIIDDIFDNENLREYFWNSITYSLFTNKFEKFNVWTGTGSNGKGVIMLLLEKALGNYMSQPNSHFLTRAEGGANSALVQCKDKKIVMVSEPEHDKRGLLKFNTSFIKKITGGDSISGRMLFKDEITFTPNFNLFCQCNEIPEIDTQDNSMKRRFVILPFKNTFVAPQDYTETHKNNPKFKIGDPELKPRIKNDDSIAQQFMLMLIERSKGLYDKELIIPEECKQASRDYINDNNIVHEFINENFEIVDNEMSMISIMTTELYNEFKNWGGFNGMKRKNFKYNLLLLNGVGEKRTNRGKTITGLKHRTFDEIDNN